MESSCDETALALVRDGHEVMGSFIASQMDIHAKWGGVIPEIAAREHLSALNGMYRELMTNAGVGIEAIDAIAVTQGPGLVGCLLVGASFAKGLAQAARKPLIPVNHVHAHVHGALLGLDTDAQNIFPTLALVVSGGHTNLYYMESPTHFELMAHTIDDACGESFDKVGKMMGLPYPGGPHVETLAAKGRRDKVPMPRMVERKSQLCFSYSGLKTAVAHAVRSAEEKGHSLADIASSFQEEALGQIIRKLKIAAAMRPKSRSVIIAGGVAANGRFRELMEESIPLKSYFPPLRYCSDNAAMIAALGYHELRRDPSLARATDMTWDVFSRYPFEKLLSADHPRT